jgi:beta-galactosidase
MDCTNKTKAALGIIYGDFTLGIYGNSGERSFHYIFSYSAGGMESLSIDGKEWLYRSPRPTFWRALTDNDRGNGFHLRSGMWLSADMFMRCTGISVTVDGRAIPLPCAPENNRYSENETAEELEITYTYETITCPLTQIIVSYGIKTNGEILVKAHYFGAEGLPELPVFGMRFVLPTAAEGFRYEGLSGETYPDRKAGGIRGVYDVEGLPVTPYLVPQDCGMHMDTQWVEVYRSKVLDNRKKENVRGTLRFEKAENPFAFSCLPYTAQELENALHQEELPPVRRTVLCVYGGVRGVGGINSWGADVEEAFHLSGEKDMEFSFRIVV